MPLPAFGLFSRWMLASLVVISHPGNIVVIPSEHRIDFGIAKRETIPEDKFRHILSIMNGYNYLNSYIEQSC